MAMLNEYASRKLVKHSLFAILIVSVILHNRLWFHFSKCVFVLRGFPSNVNKVDCFCGKVILATSSVDMLSSSVEMLTSH